MRHRDAAIPFVEDFYMWLETGCYGPDEFMFGKDIDCWDYLAAAIELVPALCRPTAPKSYICYRCKAWNRRS